MSEPAELAGFKGFRIGNSKIANIQPWPHGKEQAYASFDPERPAGLIDQGLFQICFPSSRVKADSNQRNIGHDGAGQDDDKKGAAGGPGQNPAHYLQSRTIPCWSFKTHMAELCGI